MLMPEVQLCSRPRLPRHGANRLSRRRAALLSQCTGLYGTCACPGLNLNLSPPVVQSVAEDIQQQKQYLNNFVGGQKAQLSWYVQEVAEQLAWAEAEHVRPLLMSMCCALWPLQHLLPSSVQNLEP